MKNKNMKRIIVLFILVLIIGVSIKCCTNKKTTNTVFQNMHETATDPEKTVENTSTELDNDDSKNSTEYSKNNTSSENKSNSSARNTGSTNKPSSGSNNGGTTNKPSSSSGNTNKPSSGSNNSNGGNSSNTEKPAHKHNWVNVTKTVNHPAETHQEDVYEDRQVKVKDAWDEQVKTGTAQECRQCGFRTTDGDAMTEHMLENGHSCHTVYTYETVHHDAVYETQRVKTGTKTVVDKAAWAETVVTGQKCSSCGETK